MECRFPRWLLYLLLVLVAMPVVFGVGIILASGPGNPSMIGRVIFGLVDVSILTFLVYGCFYVRRYRIRIDDDAISIRGVVRVKKIPLHLISEVITTSQPRGGTDSLVLDKENFLLTKIDGGLVGFDALLAELGFKLKPYRALFYRRGVWGPWEMRVAGDTHWVPSEPPRLARENGRRMNAILIVGFILIAMAMVASNWLWQN